MRRHEAEAVERPRPQRLGPVAAAPPQTVTRPQPPGSVQALLRLQRLHGNRYVQRALALAREADAEMPVDPEVERSIHQARGAGQALGGGVRAEMESAFGVGLEGVRVHTDTAADELNTALAARAFTTGQDIFFQRGEFDPGSTRGRELLAHELTHVVQQATAAPPVRLAVGRPGDAHEQEAERVAAMVARQPAPNTEEEDMDQG